MSSDQEIVDNNTIESRVIEFLDNAITSTNEAERVKFLTKAEEFVIHHDILDNFLDEILGFQNDRFSEVRKFVVGFIEATCKKEPDYFPKIIVNLSLMLSDGVPNVLKKVIQTLTQLYKIFLTWVATTKATEEAESTWEVWNQIKNQVFSLIDLNENDGVRTQCVKFIETVIICQTRRDQFSKEEDFSLDSIDKGNINKKLIDVEVLEEEAKQLFEQLVNFQSKIHISSINLMTTMQSLSVIACKRSKLFFNKTVLAFEHLSKNLPPTLAKSQVNSVNKQLKFQLMMLLKHPYLRFSKQQQTLTQLLLNIGVKQHDINKCVPDLKKRSLKSENNAASSATSEPANKRIKLEVDDDDEELDGGAGGDEKESIKLNLDTCLHEFSKKISRYDAIKAADITAKDLIGRLNDVNVVCDLVLNSLHLLPNDLPSDSSALNQLSLAHNDPALIAKKMAFYLTSIGIGPGVDEIMNKYIALFENQYAIKTDAEITKKISSMLKKFLAREMKNQQQSHNKVKLVQSGKSMINATSMKSEQFKLEDITKPLDLDKKIDHIEKCLLRILSCNQMANLSPKQYDNCRKIIGKFSIDFSGLPPLKSLMKNYIFQDIRSRYDILLNAIYLEYVNSKVNGKSLDNYCEYLHWIFQTVLDLSEQNDRDFFLQKLYLECPFLDQNIIDQLKKFALESNDYESLLSIIQLLIQKRRSYRECFLKILLEICIETDKEALHKCSLAIVKHIYQMPPESKERAIIEKFALQCLGRLKDDSTPPSNDEEIEILLSIYLLLLPINAKLIHELPSIYVASNAHIKRVILRLIQDTLKNTDMHQELITFVKNCPDGAETLVYRVTHTLTEQKTPSQQLVECVKELYKKKVSDVRFLIPVLGGFAKTEIIEILPQLIKLNPIVIKEVFNRLLVSESNTNNGGPISPADLMIALHNIDSSKCDLMYIIKAINVCFEEKQIFTAQVLAAVLQMLVEQNNLPTLLMRTVIQTLTNFPRLIGFVLNNILIRLIMKRVWNQKKVWEGFIKCCQRTMPQSFQVLTQLPPMQLLSVFQTCPEIKPAMIEYLQESNLPVSQTLLEVIMAPLEEQQDQQQQQQQQQTNNNNSPSDHNSDLERTSRQLLQSSEQECL